MPGGVAERPIAPVLTTGDGASGPRVRVPPPPPCLQAFAANGWKGGESQIHSVLGKPLRKTRPSCQFVYRFLQRVIDIAQLSIVISMDECRIRSCKIGAWPFQFRAISVDGSQRNSHPP